MSKQTISRLAFGAILITFLLPFASVTVFNKIAFNGFQFAFGDKNYMLPSYSSAILVLIASGVGLGASFLEKKNAAVVSIVTSVMGMFFMFSLGSRAQSGLFGGLVALEIGYYIGIMFFIGAGIASGLNLKTDTNDTVSISSPVTTKTECPKCGTQVSKVAVFCIKCGHQFGDNSKKEMKEIIKQPSMNSMPVFETKVAQNVIFEVEPDKLMKTVSTFTKPKLIGIAGPHTGQVYSVGSEKLIFGREAECSLTFEKGTPGISRIHCELSYSRSKDQFILQDNGSSYGTFLSAGTKLEIGQPYYLESGETFYLSSKSNSYKVLIEN